MRETLGGRPAYQREQIAEHFFLGPVVARVIPGTPSQAAAKSAQATVSEFSGGGWELQQAVTPVEGRPPRLFRERRVFTEHQTGRLWPRSCLRDQLSRWGGVLEMRAGSCRRRRTREGWARPALPMARLQEQLSSLTATVNLQGMVAPEMRFFTSTGSVGENSYCVLGVPDRFAMGAVGNPSSKEAFFRVNYLGMYDSDIDKQKTKRLVGSATPDRRIQNKGLPEQISVGEVIPLGEGYDIHTTSKKKGVPKRIEVARYLHALAVD